MSDEHQEFSGRSTAEAAIKACEAFGITRSQLDFRVVSETGEGLERKVLINAKAKEGVEASSQEEPRGPRKSRGERGGRGGERRDNRRDDRGENRGRGRGRGPNNSRGRDQASENVEELLELAPAEEVVATTAEVENKEEKNYSERAKVAMGVLEEIFRFCKFDIKPNLIHDKPDELQIAMVGPDSQRMIGPRGDTLLAAQFLVNRIVARKLEGEQMVVLDAANYRERRMSALEELAVKLAQRAEKDQKIVRLSPMSPHDRRVFHQTLSEIGGVRTESHGDGIYRNLLIIPSAYQAAN